MRMQKRKDTASTNRINHVYALGTIVFVGLLHKTGRVGTLYTKPSIASKAHYIPRTQGRAYYRTNRDPKNGRGKVKHGRSLPGCEALCWSVEQWYTLVIELLKAQELVKNDGDSSRETESIALQALEVEWNEVRTNMRLHRQDGAHCLVYFGDKVEYCRGVVSGEIAQAADLEAAILPVCRRYLHMAKEYETDAMQCLKGS